MDRLRLFKGVPVPGVEAGVGRRHPLAKVAALAPRSAAAGSGSAMETSSAAGAASLRASYVFPLRIRRLWPRGGKESKGSVEAAEEEEKRREDPEIEEDEEKEVATEQRKGNWVQNILRVRSTWARNGEKAASGDTEEAAAVDEGDPFDGADCPGGCRGCAVGGEELAPPEAFDSDSFSRLLRRVTLTEARLFGKMAYLGSLAYIIPKIKKKGFLKCYGMQFVTSSLEKSGKSLTSEEHAPVQEHELKEGSNEASESNERQQYGCEKTQNATGINDFAAYRIAASAASYLQSRTKGILPFGSSKTELRKDSTEETRETKENPAHKRIDEVSFMATTNSVTAVVAGNEEMKDAVAKDLNSSKTSPCDWYICDDNKSSTRYIVVQGSESLASWQANLLFEPIHFEGLDVLVHRGIYEVAKGIYQQILPDIKAHFESHGAAATLRFTGHSLGGSLALLLNLMLLIRGQVPASSLLPAVTFGSPSIMCGGDYLLHKLGLPKSHVQAITLHRDIVPRAFACHYPDHVAKILKAVNCNFRRHPCLINQKMLYAPMGKLLILQPEEKFSPQHHLLPPGSGLYALGDPSVDSERLLQAAQSAFINSPHPLEILSDRAAYGADGTVFRDHDMHSYLRSVRAVIRQELKLIRKVKRERRRRKAWWPLVAAQGIEVGVAAATTADEHDLIDDASQEHFSIAGILPGGRESLKLFRWLVDSRNVQLLVLVSCQIVTAGSIILC